MLKIKNRTTIKKSEHRNIYIPNNFIVYVKFIINRFKIGIKQKKRLFVNFLPKSTVDKQNCFTLLYQNRHVQSL